MQFTRMRLQGFKSFVDPTEVPIAPGLTGVVGPNGCGKSNLLEALRWVMGETSPKSMRGDGMEDVIFAGSGTRPARPWAEVSLLVDNEDRTAPAAFNKADSLEIARRITRDLGSAYRLNGKDVRARDVRMLFADASTGSHSPALVRQGRIAELIDAKPKARRAILEEAAGIGGLYQRRHEAELKLRSAEANLSRVSDVLESLDQQLSSLARQARQAATYREVAAELKRAEALLLWLRWREAEAARAEAETALRQALGEAARTEAASQAAARAQEAAEAAVPPLREEEAVAAAVLQRALVERERIDERLRAAEAEAARLAGRAAQLERDLERERALGRDAGESEAALDREERELREAEAGQPERLAAAEEAARAAAATVEAEEAALDRLTGDAARLAARVQAAERRAAETAKAAGEAAAARDRAEGEAARLADGMPATQAAQAQAEAEVGTARAEAEAAESALGAAETARGAAQEAEASARADSAGAEGEASALRAEVRALEGMLAKEGGDGTRMLDRVEVEAGWEKALGAALGDDLLAGEAGPGSAGWEVLEGDAEGGALPEGVEPLADRVTAPPVLARRLARIGVVAPEAGERLRGTLAAGVRLVSRDGDLWRWDGWRAAAGEAPTAAARRLEQRNRLAALTASLEVAEAAASEAKETAGAAKGALSAAATAETEAREARRRADARLAAAEKALGRAETELDLRRGRLATLEEAVAARREAAEATEAEARAAAAETEGLGDVAAAKAAAESAKGVVQRARAALAEARGTADEARRAGERRARRLGGIETERAGWARRREAAGQRIAELEARLEETTEELAAARAAPGELETRRQALVAAVTKAEARSRAAADALAVGETALREATRAAKESDRAAGEAREDRARAEALLEAAAGRAAAAAERLTEETGASPEALAETLSVDAGRPPQVEETELAIVALRRRRDALGAVNLRAEEDAREVSGERDSLAGEKADLEAAIAKLRQGVASLNSEGRKRLLAAFEEVNANFRRLFETLFGGGQADLVLVESDDPLEAGLEIMCQPPGKKLSTLSLLSGGEQTLTALALIFGVFLANPAPICVLDEVDAPLDDANVTRFCDMLEEMRASSGTRFLVITHHALTMARMDRLFGVTMAERGVSQLVSVDLAKAEAMVEG